MARRLAEAVHYTDPETGETYSYLPGVVPPPEHAERITNPAAWEPEPDPEASKSSYQDLSKSDLVDLAARRQVELPSTATKPQIIAALEAQDAKA